MDIFDDIEMNNPYEEAFDLMFMQDLDIPNQTFTSFASLREAFHGYTLGELNDLKPYHAPRLPKWFKNGGKIQLSNYNGEYIWKYIYEQDMSVEYSAAFVSFPPEAKHPYIKPIYIGEFSTDRNTDKRLYIEKLKEEYGLNDIPNGYSLHHTEQDGYLELIKDDYHTIFSHYGGNSMKKQDLF